MSHRRMVIIVLGVSHISSGSTHIHKRYLKHVFNLETNVLKSEANLINDFLKMLIAEKTMFTGALMVSTEMEDRGFVR